MQTVSDEAREGVAEEISPEEQRLARRRGLIVGVLQRNGLPTDAEHADEPFEALVDAGTDNVLERTKALVDAVTNDGTLRTNVAADLLMELNALEQDTAEAELVSTEPASEPATASDESPKPEVDELVNSDVVAGNAAPDSAEAVDSAAPAGEAGPPAVDERHELPVHRVTCMAKGCKSGALYRPTSSGTGFMILERYGIEPEVTIGVGKHGRPVCPREDHGEMTLADDQLPAGEAIAKVAKQINEADGRKQPRLPGIIPPFNFEGALAHIVEKRHEVKALEKKLEERQAASKKTKAELDEAQDTLNSMIDDYEERSRERQFELERQALQLEQGHPQGTTLVRCTWEQQHQNDRCPLCATSATVHDRQEMVRLIGAEVLPRDAQGHADQVVIYRTRRDVEETGDALEGLIIGIHPASIAEWSAEDRARVRDWAKAQQAALPEWLDEMPDVLGKPHVAAGVADDAKVQACITCRAVLRQMDDASKEALPFGRRVGTDCPGSTEAIEGHRYPERKAKPRGKRQAPAPAKPTKPSKAKPETKGGQKKATAEKSGGRGKGRR